MRILDQQFESLGCDLKIKTLRHMRGIGRACVEDSFLLLPKLLQTSLLAAERMVKSQSAELGAAGSLQCSRNSAAMRASHVSLLVGRGGVLSRHARAVRCELLHPSTSAGPHVRFGQPKRTENGVNGAIAKRPNN